MPVPERTTEQRMAALRKANIVRARKAERKRDLKAGRMKVSAIIAAPPPYMDKVRLADLLPLGKSIGPAKAKRILSAAHLPPGMLLGKLDDRTRDSLLRAVREVEDRIAARSEERREPIPA